MSAISEAVKDLEKHKYNSEWYNLRPILGNAN